MTLSSKAFAPRLAMLGGDRYQALAGKSLYDYSAGGRGHTHASLHTAATAPIPSTPKLFNLPAQIDAHSSAAIPPQSGFVQPVSLRDPPNTFARACLRCCGTAHRNLRLLHSFPAARATFYDFQSVGRPSRRDFQPSECGYFAGKSLSPGLRPINLQLRDHRTHRLWLSDSLRHRVFVTSRDSPI
jgi:hypothetical protein